MAGKFRLSELLTQLLLYVCVAAGPPERLGILACCKLSKSRSVSGEKLPLMRSVWTFCTSYPNHPNLNSIRIFSSVSLQFAFFNSFLPHHLFASFFPGIVPLPPHFIVNSYPLISTSFFHVLICFSSHKCLRMSCHQLHFTQLSIYLISYRFVLLFVSFMFHFEQKSQSLDLQLSSSELVPRR